jgi:hypothetical protein
MGRSAKTIIAVVAAIAIPYVAPAVASTIGLSSAIGAAAANTVTGAVLGAGVAKATGGNVATGAILGGVGSYLNTPSPTPTGTGITTSATGTSGITAPGVTSTTAAVPSTITTMPTTDYSNILSQGVSAGGEGFSLAGGTTTGFTGAGAGAAGLNYSDFGAQLSGPTTSAASGLGPIDYGFTTTPSAGFSAPATSASAAASGLGPIDYSVASAPATTAGLSAPTVATSGVDYSLTAGGATPTLSAAASAPMVTGGVPGAVAQQAAAAAPLTAGQKALEFTKAIGGDLIKTAAMVYALGAANVPGEIPADQMAMYQEELERLARENPAAYQAQLNEAQKFLQQAEALDPDYFGQQRARSEQIRGARQKSAGLRGLTGRQRAAAERQYDIATGRAAGTAYESGAQTALTGQLQTRQAGLALMPKPSEYSTLSSLQNLGGIYRDQATARRQYAQDVGMFADLGASIYDKGRNIYS